MKLLTKKKLQGAMLCATSAALIASLGLSSGSTLISAFAGAFGGKYYASYSSLDDALEAAGDLNLQVAEEGNTLLKNDGTLPLTGSERVSVFGVSSSSLVGATGNTNSVGNADGVSSRGAIYDSLTDAGFKVNTVLADYYAEGNGASDIGNETTSFSGSLASSINMYNEVGVIVIARNAGEGADADMVINEEEDEKYQGKDQGWEHKGLYTGAYKDSVAETSGAYDTNGTKYKHYLELTESEEELIKYVEGKCNKVVVVLNTANAMEIYNLKNDDKINGILLMGRPGETGHTSVGEILKGSVNPSGHLVDEWNTDFSADPTWSNFGWNYQNGSQNIYYYKDSSGNLVEAGDPEYTQSSYGTHSQYMYYGTDYEEDIYLGYAYWETAYYEKYNQLTLSGTNEAEAISQVNEWYEKNVAYGFGYGLSYTTFAMNIDASKMYYTGNSGVKTSIDLANDNLASLFYSESGHVATAKTLYIPVTVTNTGSMSGKEVAQVYVTAPYTNGGVEKSFVTLVGYAKTDILRPGQSQTVYVQVNVQDMASFDYNDANNNGTSTYELDAGEYTIRVMESSHYDLATDTGDTSDAYDEVKFSLSSTVALALDDFSDNEATALFSEEFSIDNCNSEATTTDATHSALQYCSIRSASMMEDETSGERLISRDATSSEYIVSYFPEAPTMGDLTFKYEVVDNWNYWNDFTTGDTEVDEWYVATDDIPSNWTQGTGDASATGMYATTIDMMIGEELRDSSTESGYSAAWDNFMNQFTLDELTYLVRRSGSMWTTSELATIGKISSTQADSYNDVRTAGGTFLWVDSPTLSATWNTELANKVGMSRGNIEILNGWSGYGGKEMDTHRSPFSGRNAEYLSQDGIQGGYIAAAFTSGMESMGVTCYIKHFAFNDSETCRDGMNNNVWLSEQAARQIYLKVFQMAMQEGGSSASMTGFASFCGITNSMNFRLCNTLVCGEWGWDGFFITDGYSGVSCSTTMDTMLRSYVIPLPLGSTVPELSGTWDATLRNGKGDVSIDGVESSTQYYYIRTCAMRILYADVNSNDVLNGFTVTSMENRTFTVTQGSSISEQLGFTDEQLNGSTAVYEISGTLPSGVTLTTDGLLSGTPTEAGTFQVQMTATIDGWVTSSLASGLSATYTIVVESAFSTTGDDLATYEVGQAYRTAITTTITGWESAKYSVVSGDLEAYGLSLDASTGYISGTPTKGGTINLTVQVGLGSTTEVSMPWGGTMTSESYDYYTVELTIVIAGDTGDDVVDTTTQDTTYLTSSEVEAMIKEAIESLDLGLTESQVQSIVEQAISGADTSSLTASEVQAMIDSAIANIDTTSGCSSAIGTTFATITALCAVAFVGLVATRKSKKN